MSWSFARTPKWIVRHVAVVLLVAAMVAAGLWQLRRLDDRRELNDLVEARQAAPVEPVSTLVPADAAVDDPEVEAARHRRVTATGTYADEDTVAVHNRSLNGAAGAWVLTPLVLSDGTAVVVNRGFVGFDRDGDIVPPAVPDGEVTVEGLVQESQVRGRFGPRDPADGRLDVLARVDLDRYESQVDHDLLPVFIQLVRSEPPQPEPAEGLPALVPLPAPELTDGPHLSYAAQWFIFTVIAAGGYVLLLRKVARQPGDGDGPPSVDDVDRELAELLDGDALR